MQRNGFRLKTKVLFLWTQIDNRIYNHTTPHQKTMLSFLKRQYDYYAISAAEIAHARREFGSLVSSIKDFLMSPKDNPIDWDCFWFSLCEATFVNAMLLRFSSRINILDLRLTGSKNFKFDFGHWGMHEADMKMQWVCFVIFTEYFISRWKSLEEARLYILNDENYVVPESNPNRYSKESIEHYNAQLQMEKLQDREMLSVAEWFLESMTEEHWQDDPNACYNNTSDKMFSLVVKYCHSMWH